MTSQQPTDFENYPVSRQPDAISDPPPVAVTPYLPPSLSPAPQPSGGLGRRGLLGLLIGVPVAGLLGAAVFGAGAGEGRPEATASASEWIGGDDSESDSYIDVGGEQYTATIPDTWESINTEGDEVVVTRGNNRLLALAVTDDGARQVTDQLDELVAQYHGPFKGKLGEAVDTSSSDVRRATLTAKGTYNGAEARVRADLWIDGEDNGLLVIQTLTAGKDSKIAREAQAIADELSSDF
ncbi:MAG: hypothetical protein LCH96_17730 [Actinobacteria bacterium]|nr:hypothetical protein [Actinomycetota bacterium]